MTLRFDGGSNARWRDEGRKAVAGLRWYSALVFVGPDAEACASAALGVSDVEGSYRPVVIVNIAGSSILERVLRSLENPPGVSDCFEFGISFGAAARSSRINDRLTVIGSGPDTIDTASVLRSPRWKAYADRVVETGALLILVVSDAIKGLDDLIGQVDGAIEVGSITAREISSRTILGRIDLSAPSLPPEIQEERKAFGVGKSVIGGLAFLLTLGAAALAYYFYPELRSRIPVSFSGSESAPPPRLIQTPAPAPEPQYRSTTIANAQDSLNSPRFSVEILAANTLSGAIFSVRKYRTSIPAGTVSAIPVGPDQALWYKVIGGAFERKEDADSLLVSLRRKKIVPAGSGSVVETPLAFLIDSIPSDAAMATRVKKAVDNYLTRDLVVYGLVQSDGSARLYSGAFSNPSESTAYFDQLKRAGVNPILVYRTGRNP